MQNLRSIIFRNLSILSFVFIALVAGFWLLFASISKQEVFGEIVNKSGKLRMITQKMNLNTVLYNQSMENSHKANLVNSIKEFQSTKQYVIDTIAKNEIVIDKDILSNNIVKEYIFHIENFANTQDANSYRFILANSSLVIAQLDHFITHCIEAQKDELNFVIFVLVAFSLTILISGIVYYFYVFTPVVLDSKRLIVAIDDEKKKNKNIIDNINSIIFTKDENGIYTFVNKAFKLFLSNDKEILGFNDFDVFDKKLALQFISEDKEVMKNNRAKVAEYDIVIHDTNKTFYITKFPLKNDHNEITGVCGIALDITAKKELENELKKYKDNLSKAQEIAKIGSFEFDIKSRHFVLSEQCSIILGLGEGENLMSFENCSKLVHSKDLLLVTTVIEKVCTQPTQEIFEFRLMLDNGFIKIININIQSVLDDMGVLKVIGTVQDFTAKKETEKKLQEFNSLIDKYVISSTTDLEGIITNASEAFCAICGYTLDELIGKNHNIVRHQDMDVKIFEEMWETIERGEIWQGEVKNKNKDGGFYWVDTVISPIYGFNGQKIGYSSVRIDITDKKIIEIMSITDALTNLYNRRFFNELFSKSINTAIREKNLFGFFIADIDNFKKYNDTYGHLAGDGVLSKVGEVFKNNLSRPQDYPFRLGGEEFGGILNTMDIQNTIKYVEKLKMDIENLNVEHKLNIPYEKVTISVGLVIIDSANLTENISAEMVYEMADSKLYEAKQSGRNRVVSGVIR